jgi:hypothetical protein
MKRFFAIAFAISLGAGPVSALADSFKVGNITGRTLNFGIRCDDRRDTWHLFTLDPMTRRAVGSGAWGYDCAVERYDLRIGTVASNGSTTYQTVILRPGNDYALVESSQHNGYIAYDTRWIVAIRNDAPVTVHVGYSCVDGPAAQGTATVPPSSASSPPSWFYSKGCATFNVATSVTERNGSNKTWSKDIASNNNYRIVWSGARKVYLLEQL